MSHGFGGSCAGSAAIEASIDGQEWRNLEELARLCRDNDISLVAVQFPMAEKTVKFLENDAGYWHYSGVWREFETADFARKVSELGITFFDLSHEKLTEDSSLFMDAAHLTERGMAKAMEGLTRDERFRSIFPRIDSDGIAHAMQQAVENGDSYEVYHDQVN
jgi:hypothetical protein